MTTKGIQQQEDQELFSDTFRENYPKLLQNLNAFLEQATGSKHHYTAHNIQTVDVWDSLGSIETTARDTAIKYLMRYGKKDGKNVNDLLKAIHYILMIVSKNHSR